MASFTAKRLKEMRIKFELSQDEMAKIMKISRRKLQKIEAGEVSVCVDEIMEFAKAYKVDVRELLLEEYLESSEEKILCDRYSSVVKLIDQLSDKDREDIVWLLKQRIAGKL